MIEPLVSVLLEQKAMDELRMMLYLMDVDYPDDANREELILLIRQQESK